MTPVPPNISRNPITPGSAQQGSFAIYRRDPKTQQYLVSGPFHCDRIPMSGSLVSVDRANQLVAVDEQIFLPPSTVIDARSTVQEVRTGEHFTVVYVRRWSDKVVVSLKRVAPA